MLHALPTASFAEGDLVGKGIGLGGKQEVLAEVVEVEDAVGHVQANVVRVQAVAADLPAFHFPEEAVGTMKILRQRACWLEVEHKPPERLLGVNPLRAHQLLSEVSLGNRTSLEPAEACELLEAYGIATPKDLLASSADKAVEYAKVIGYPVALKLASPDILHKSDVGGVVLNLTDDESVRKAFESIITRAREAHPQAQIRGMQLQQMVTGGQEVIVGMQRDPAFGPERGG